MQAKLAGLSCGLRKGSVQIVEIGKSETVDRASPGSYLDF